MDKEQYGTMIDSAATLTYELQPRYPHWLFILTMLVTLAAQTLTLLEKLR